MPEPHVIQHTHQRMTPPARNWWAKVSAVAGLVGAAIVCGGWLFFAMVFPETGWDFSQFYITAGLPIESIYDRAAFESRGVEQLAPLGVDYFPPYVRPAVFSLPLGPLAFLSYTHALWLFAGIQFLFLCIVLFLLNRRFGLPCEMIPAFMLCYPAMMGIITGQDPHTLLLLVLSGFLLLEKGRDILAGCTLALCLYKFNLILWLPLLLLARRRWTALGSFCAAGVALAAASALLAPPGDYLRLLANIEQYTIAFTPESMIGFRALSVTLGWEPLYFLVSPVLVAVGFPLLRNRPLPEAYMLAIIGSMLCSYHVNWYDGALLLIPIALVRERGSAPAQMLGSVLLAVFPLWVYRPVIASMVALLWVLIAWKTPRSSEAVLAPSPASVSTG